MVLKANTSRGNNVVVDSNSSVPANVTGGNMVDLNAGILEGIEGIGESNRVSIDGTEFEYKNKDKRVKELNVLVTYGRRLYQYWDENNTLCQSFDGKVSTDDLLCATCENKKSKKCKFKFEVRWQEIDPDSGEPEEVIMTLPTVSSINFVEYVKSLAKQGLGVNQVITNVKIERKQNTSTNSKYSVAVFTNAGMVETDQH